MPVQLPESVERMLRLVRVDFEPEHRQPAAGLVLAATAVALAGSLLADAILVKIGEMAFPATKGYVHFRFSDYAKLTIIGVIIACVAWPIVTRISSEPRWLFFRQAIAVTLVLFLPDLYLLYKGQPADAVAVLMLMHVAIALVTYNALVHIAKVRPAVTSHRHAGGRARRRDAWDEDYGREDYAREDYGREDYGRGDYAREDYGRGDYGDYGREDYGRGAYGGRHDFPGDRYPEPARSYTESGYGYTEPARGYPEPARSYSEPARRYTEAGYGEQDDPYESYFRKPANPHEDRRR